MRVCVISSLTSPGLKGYLPICNLHFMYSSDLLYKRIYRLLSERMDWKNKSLGFGFFFGSDFAQRWYRLAVLALFSITRTKIVETIGSL